MNPVNADRLRGASALLGYPDTLLGITQDANRVRYLEATGRGVEPELVPTELSYHPETRTMALGAETKTSKAQDIKKAQAEAKDGKQAIVRAERINMAVQIARLAGADGIASGKLFVLAGDALGAEISKDARSSLLSILETREGVSVVQGPRGSRVVRVSS